MNTSTLLSAAPVDAHRAEYVKKNMLICHDNNKIRHGNLMNSKKNKEKKNHHSTYESPKFFNHNFVTKNNCNHLIGQSINDNITVMLDYISSSNCFRKFNAFKFCQ